MFYFYLHKISLLMRSACHIHYSYARFDVNFPFKPVVPLIPGWDINQRMQSTFMTPLMCAAINGHMTTSQKLMERGCDPNLTDVNDKTALLLASERGKREVVGFLDRKTSGNLTLVQEEESKLDIIEATKNGKIDSLLIICSPLRHSTNTNPDPKTLRFLNEYFLSVSIFGL